VVNAGYDERRDYYKSTHAAARYLLSLYKSMKDWLLVIAAYNGGPGSNKPSTACSGKTLWQCTGNSGYSETRHYVKTVLLNYASLKDNGWMCQ
jgi:membrane-bound lytic murein transglycosylase D